MQGDDEGYTMTPKDRAIAEAVAQHTVARMLDAAQSPEVAGRVIDTWAGHVQQVVGRAVLRLALYLFLLALAIASYKFGLLDSLLHKVKQ